MNEITHILYDLGNTLIYFEGEWPQVFRKASIALGEQAAHLQLPVAPERLAERFRSKMQAYYDSREESLVEQSTLATLTGVLADLNVIDLPLDICENLLSAFYQVTQSHWQPYPAARSTLLALRDRGYAQGVLSNAAYDRDVQELVDKADLRSTLDFVLSSAAIGFRKPHPQAFQAALSRWGVRPEHVLMVGDTLNADVLGAARSGIRSAWMREYATPVTATDETLIRPDFTLETITDLPYMLENHQPGA